MSLPDAPFNSFGPRVMNAMPDQRNSIRFRTENSIFTNISGEAICYHAAMVIDVSQEGMAFRYLGEDPINAETNELDILHEDGFSLIKVPVKIVSDIMITCRKIRTRRCGVKFGELTAKQKAQLDYLIKNYNAGSA